MADGIIPGRKTFERIEKALPLVERFLPPPPQALRSRDDSEKRVWYKCVPDSSGVPLATAFGVVQIVSVTLDASEQPIIRYKRPDADSVLNTAIIYGQDIPAGTVSGAEGLCTLEPTFALYNTAATPALGEDWGTEANTFQLKEGNTGYKILGAAGSGRVFVRKPDSAATGPAKFIQFTLPSALLTTQASKASCTVNNYWDGTDPGATVTVWNLEASSDYIFSGLSGNKGVATYDDRSSKYRIINLECP